MISDIDRATPIVFCQRLPVFAESAEYRSAIVQKFGLANVSMNDGHWLVKSCRWRSSTLRTHVGSFQRHAGQHVAIAPPQRLTCAVKMLDKCCLPHSPSQFVNNRVDVDGKLIKVDPLLTWSRENVRTFMRSNELPYHKMAKREFTYDDKKEGGTYPMYNFKTQFVWPALL